MASKVEIERKFIIKMPSAEALQAMPNYSKSDICQIYVESPRGITHRVRSRKYPDRTDFTETVKIRLDKMSADENESFITEERFLEMSKKIKSGTAPLIKVRHTFDWHGHTFEINIYPEWEDTCILEVELTSRDEAIEFPEVITPICEVTGVKAYTNAAMSQRFPCEVKVQ